MTTRKDLIALVGATIIVGVTACGGSNTAAQSSETVTSPPASTGASSSSAAPSSATSTTVANAQACSTLGGQVDADRVCTVHTQAPVYTIDMKFPSDYPDQPGLTGILTKMRDGFVEAAAVPARPGAMKALDSKPTTYRSGTPETGTESLVLEEYVNLAGAHPTTSYDALNYDLAKKAPIPFDTLFKPGSDPVAVLDPILTNDFKTKMPGIPVDPNPAGAEMYKSFALTDEAVIFLIGQGNWLIEAAGPQQVSVPRSQLAAILA